MGKLRSWSVAGVAMVVLAAACTSGGSSGSGGDSGSDGVGTPGRGGSTTAGAKPDRGAGFVDEMWFRRRQDQYLRYATAKVDRGSALNLIAQFERGDRDPNFHFDPSTIKVSDFAPVFQKLDTFQDTGDFDMLWLLNLWYADHDRLPKDVQAAIEKRILAFKYWYTEPTPKGVIDQKWYWSENHRAIYHTIEMLAAQAFPDATFTNDGKSAAEHLAHGKRLMDDWLAEKARFGFDEWHSDVYYQEDIAPLLTLVELSDDATMARKASIMLDQVMLDIALHLQKGDFGATHGRSYMKDKSIATDQDTFAITKLLFDDTTLPYDGTSTSGVTLFRGRRSTGCPR